MRSAPVTHLCKAALFGPTATFASTPEQDAATTAQHVRRLALLTLAAGGVGVGIPALNHLRKRFATKPDPLVEPTDNIVTIGGRVNKVASNEFAYGAFPIAAAAGMGGAYYMGRTGTEQALGEADKVAKRAKLRAAKQRFDEIRASMLLSQQPKLASCNVASRLTDTGSELHKLAESSVKSAGGDDDGRIVPWPLTSLYGNSASKLTGISDPGSAVAMLVAAPVAVGIGGGIMGYYRGQRHASPMSAEEFAEQVRRRRLAQASTRPYAALSSNMAMPADSATKKLMAALRQD